MIKNSLIRNNFFLKNPSLKIFKSVNNQITKSFKSINSNKDALNIFSKNFDLNLNKNELKRFKKFKNIVIVGMGGSSLGTKAIFSFLEEKIKKKLFFLDNLNLAELQNFKKKLDIKVTLFIIVSKSGNTLETLVNANFLKNKINKRNSIIISERTNNLLKQFADKNNIYFIEHKNYIGGRYSVLSEVGMVPAYLMNLNIKLFRQYLSKLFNGEKKKILINSVAHLKEIYRLKKINSIIFLNYAPELNDFLFWCQQLIAESLGKNNFGLMPVVSIAPRDHHSLLQLYLDGPKDKLFYIFSSNQKDSAKTNSNIFGKGFNYAENKNFNKIKLSQKKALIQALKNKKISFREFEINKSNESTLGELFGYFMLETVFLGKALGVDPYNQPAVEEVKILTKKNLI